MTDTNDYGPRPFVMDVEKATIENDLFRVTKWTGTNLQMTLMAIQPGDSIGLEVHTDHDQFLRIEQGSALVEMGASETTLEFIEHATKDFAIFVPAGMWHNLTNEGDEVLKLYSIYAPPEHKHGTIHQDKAEADAAEHGQ